MNDRFAHTIELGFNIAGVERDTGLSKDTLRVWERRYGFPRPQRDEFGQRLYSADDVRRLRVIRRLTDAGLRPGKIITLPLDRLEALAAERATRARPAVEPRVSDGRADFIELIRQHRIEVLRAAMSQELARKGLARFVTEVVAPLNIEVGDAWARGRLEVYEEHLYSEVVEAVLRHGIGSLSVSERASPRVLLTTFPDEGHGIGLLMAEAMIVLEGGSVVPLGVGTPIWDILAAARRQQADVVGLSFSPCLSAKRITDGLRQMRAGLPDEVEIWVGGRHPILRRRPPSGVRVFGDLADLVPAIVGWRSRPQTKSVSTPV